MKQVNIILRNYFVAGILVLAPIGLTAWLLHTLIRLADKLFVALLPLKYHPEQLFNFWNPIFGLCMAIVVVLCVGILARNFIGKKLISWGENLVTQIPLVRTVYNAIKKLLATVLDENSQNFKKVVILEYPRRGIYSVGFVTADRLMATIGGQRQPLISVFIPTTPNPTSGFYMLAPENQLTYLDITTEEAFKLIVSFGIVTPEHFRGLILSSKSNNT